MGLSILHRVTGVALSVGLIAYTAWLVSAAGGTAEYSGFTALMSTIVGRLLLIAWSFAFFYHLSNGVRHMLWDTGRAFEMRQVNAGGWIAIVAAITMTAAFWIVLL